MRPNHEHIRLLMQELAGTTSEITAIDAHGNAAWIVHFGPEVEVLAEAAADPERIVLSAQLGKPNSAMQQSVCETLLSYNLLWRETGGVKAGRRSPDEEMTLLFELYADQLSLSDLSIVMVNFSNLTRVWRSYILSDAPTTVEPEQKMGGSVLDMRV